jgi:hypothetical protein
LTRDPFIQAHHNPGPFDQSGAVNYRILAFDSPGNRSDPQFHTLTIKVYIP